MAKKVTDEALGHDYDGIQEYDNPLPRWWVWLFVGTVVFAIAYIPYYHGGPGELPTEAHARQMQEWEALHPAAPLPDDAALAEMATPERLEAGRSIFTTRCAACHAPDGGGQVGPNLTDEYSIHGHSRATIVRVIHDGVPEKGMIAWGQQLTRDELYAVGLFVYGLVGQAASNPKAPQGDRIAMGEAHHDTATLQ